MEAGGHRHPIEEGVGIGGFSDSTGSHRTYPTSLVELKHPSKIPENVYCGPKAFRTEFPPSKSIVSEPHSALQVFEHLHFATG
jgi:hypothetical protein